MSALTLDVARQQPGAARFVEGPRGFTHVEVGGPPSGPRVVLVHGLTTPMFAWDPTFSALVAAGCRVVRYDQYGRGWSRAAAGVSFDTLVDQLDDVVLLDGPGPVSVVAWSWGCGVAATWAARDRSRVRSVTLVAPGGLGSGYQASFRALRTPLLGEALVATIGRAALLGDARRCFVRPDAQPAYFERFRAQLAFDDYGPNLLALLRRSPGDFAAAYRALGRSGLPVAAIWGTGDAKTPWALRSALVDAVPDATVQGVEDAGHAVQIEQAEAFNHWLLPRVG